ncbi:MAG: solute carrier family 23 protein [Pleomorphochaeta sp.]
MALQYVVAMVVGCVTPALIISQAVTSSVDNHGIISVQSARIIASIATFIQLFPIGKYFGSKSPVIMGVRFAYLSTMLAIAVGYSFYQMY